MSAIPEAVGARCVRRGVIRRALLRVALLGGLVIAGWVLGSGTALAGGDWGHGELDYEEFVQQHASVIPLIKASSASHEEVDDLPGMPSSVRPTVKGMLRAAPVPNLRAQPPAQIPVLAPVLAHAAQSESDIQSGLVRPIDMTPTQAAIDQPAAVSPAAVQDVAKPAPAPIAVVRAVGELPLATAVSAGADSPVAVMRAKPATVGVDPLPPLPVNSPPATTTAAACLVGSTGGNAGAKGDRLLMVLGDAPEAAWLTPTRLRLCHGAGGIPRSVAQQPSTSPD